MSPLRRGLILLLSALALTAGGGEAWCAERKLLDRVAAVVNDDVVALSEVYELGGEFIDAAMERCGAEATCRRDAELKVLDQLIQRRLVNQELDKLGQGVTTDDLDRAIASIAATNGMTRDQLQERIEEEGIPWDVYQTELREQVGQMKFTDAVLRNRVTITEDELKALWRKKVSASDLPQEVELGAIAIKVGDLEDPAQLAAAKSKAEVARARVLAGESWATVALELDELFQGKDGGRWGKFGEGMLGPEMNQAAFHLPVGGVSEPIVLAPLGVFIISPLSRQAVAPVPFEQLRPELEEAVYQQRMVEETEEWTEQARRQASVLIKLEAKPPGVIPSDGASTIGAP